MLTDLVKKIKEWGLKRKDEIFIVLAIILVGAAGFGLGRLSKIIKSKPPLIIENGLEKSALISSIEKSPRNSNKVFVGSKNGVKYHFPWCPGALRISEQNKVWFESRQAAEKAGYSKAANCVGL